MMTRTKWHPALWLVTTTFLLAAACGGGAVSSTDVTQKDFSIGLGDDTFKAGDVTFHITNDGPAVHEFVVFQTDLDEGALPTTTDADGNKIVDEKGEGLEAVDEVEDIAVDSPQDFKVNLASGSYVAICNLPGHYDSGMHVPFTVE